MNQQNDDIALDWNAYLDYSDALPTLDTVDEKQAMDDIILLGRPKRPRSHFHASAVLQKPLDYYKRPLYCERACVLSQFYETNEVIHPPKKSMIFENGWHFHMRWQEMFQRAGILLMSEVPFFVLRYKMLFTMDAVIQFMGVPHVVELKGYNNREFVRLLKGKIPEDAYLQCQLYLHLYHDTHNKQLEDGLIIVENKDTQEYKMWRMKRNPLNVTAILERLESIRVWSQIHEKTQHLPSRLCAECSDLRACECSMASACFSESPRCLESSIPDGVTVL